MSLGTGPEHVTVAGVMQPPVTAVEQDGHAAAAAFLMKRAGSTALVVLDDEHNRRPIGLITESTIVQAIADGKDVNEVRIRDLMTRRPTVISPSTSVREAAERMLAENLRNVPVVDDVSLVGVVELGDVCRVLLQPR